ncbi:MAG: hypothetical protein ACP5HC_02005 [Caldisericum sp.]
MSETLKNDDSIKQRLEVEKDKTEKWHTRRWYKENYGVDPLKLGIPFREVRNPYYRKAPPMKLWKEEDVAPFKNTEGVEKFKKRQQAGQKAFETRKKRLKEWFSEIKDSNPRVKEILHRLWQIGERIKELHRLKENCRTSDPDYNEEDFWDYGIEHCPQCAKWSEEQWQLREERYELFNELEEICQKDKRTIQLARRYLREDKTKTKKEEKE